MNQKLNASRAALTTDLYFKVKTRYVSVEEMDYIQYQARSWALLHNLSLIEQRLVEEAFIAGMIIGTKVDDLSTY